MEVFRGMECVCANEPAELDLLEVLFEALLLTTFGAVSCLNFDVDMESLVDNENANSNENEV